MNTAEILHWHKMHDGHTLLVDGAPTVEATGITKLSDFGISVDELWVGDHPLRTVQNAILSKPRSARDLFRALENLERFVVLGGTILILPYTTEAGPENRFEATEVFMGLHTEWERTVVSGNTIALTKGKASPPRELVVARVPSKRVVSLALFGEGGYWDFVAGFVRAHLKLFPNYELRIHHDDMIDHVPYGKVLKRLWEKNVLTLVRMEANGLAHGKCRSMLWRLAPAWDADIEYVFARDTDSLPMWRDRMAVEEFIASGRDLHTIHDAEAHAGIMGGLCGFRAASLRKLFPTFSSFIDAAGYSDERWARHGADQDYLNRSIRPHLTTFGHSLRVKGHNRDAAMGSIRYVTEIATPSEKVISSVSEKFRSESDTLAPYLGSAGYPLERACDFYDEFSFSRPVADAECEVGYTVGSPEIAR